MREVPLVPKTLRLDWAVPVRLPHSQAPLQRLGQSSLQSLPDACRVVTQGSILTEMGACFTFCSNQFPNLPLIEDQTSQSDITGKPSPPGFITENVFPNIHNHYRQRLAIKIKLLLKENVNMGSHILTAYGYMLLT